MRKSGKFLQTRLKIEIEGDLERKAQFPSTGFFLAKKTERERERERVVKSVN